VAGVRQSIKRAVEDLAALREAMGDRIAELTASVRGGRAEWKADLSKAVPSNDSRMPPGGGASGKGEGAIGGGKADASSKADLPDARDGSLDPRPMDSALVAPAATPPEPPLAKTGFDVVSELIRLIQGLKAPIERPVEHLGEQSDPPLAGRKELLDKLGDGQRRANPDGLSRPPEHEGPDEILLRDVEHPPVPDIVKGLWPAGIGDLPEELLGALRAQGRGEVTSVAVRPGADGPAGGGPLADALGLDSLGDEARAALGEVSQALQAFVSGLEEKLAAGQSRLGAALFEGFVERLRDRLESELRRG